MSKPGKSEYAAGEQVESGIINDLSPVTVELEHKRAQEVAEAEFRRQEHRSESALKRDEQRLDNAAKRAKELREQWFALIKESSVALFFFTVTPIALYYTAQLIRDPATSPEARQLSFAFWGAVFGAITTYLFTKKSGGN